MAVKKSGIILGTAEYIVSNPIRATITVGTTITVLQLLVGYATQFLPEMRFVLFLMPFIPPYFVTRTAKRINQKRAEHEFINDAEPYIFVAFPKRPSVESLLRTLPDMVSDSAGTHTNIPVDQLLNMEILPPAILANPEERTKIAEELITDFRSHGSRGVVKNFQIMLRPSGQTDPVPYLMNSVLKYKDGRLKWQGTLMNQVALK